MFTDNDDAFVRMPDSQEDYEGGHGHSDKKEDSHGHGHGEKKEEKHGHGHGHGAKKEEHGHGHGHGAKKEDHGHGHGHGDKKKGKKDLKEEDLKNYNASMKKLKLVSFVSIFFIAAQLTGGYLANSIAIYTDSAHLASDMIGFGISMAALKMSMRPASKELTFGWHRAEILGTLCSIVFLLTLTIWLVFEAVDRVIERPEVKGFEMIITAIGGLCFNLIQMHILHQGEGGYQLGEKAGHGHSHDDDSHGHSHGGGGGNSLAVDAAFLHALSDMIMSIGVCIAAGIIEFATWKYGYIVDENGTPIDHCADDTCFGFSGEQVECRPCLLANEKAAKFFIADPICTFVFSVLVCISVYPVVKKCILVLMEGTPSGFDLDGLISEIKALASPED